MSEGTTTVGRSQGEIVSGLTEMLTAPEEQPTKDSSLQEQPELDSEELEQQQIDAESAEDSVVEEEYVEEPALEQSEDDQPIYTVKVDGEEMNVSLNELQQGYQRGATFTQRQQALAEERQKLEADRQQLPQQQNHLQQTQQEYQNVLSQLYQQMEAAHKAPDIDMAKLEQENPVQWMKLKILERDRVAEMQSIQQEQQRMQAMMHEAQQQKQAEQLSRERAIVLEKIPEWKDTTVQNEEQRKLFEYGKTLEFTDTELGGLYDHRSLIVLRKAMLYDELTGGKKMKQAKSKIGTVKGGNKELASRSLSRQQKAARNKLRQTGKVQDAAALMGQLLAD
tara:strand:+ start:4464 stop:5474 length:1011 start_codon:yes stop_codon:yes gene_type:complete